MFKTSNNQDEYEALLVGLRMAKELGVRRIVIKGDSQLIIGQVKGGFQAKEPQLQQYLAKIKELVREFEEYIMEYILRDQNAWVDLLSKLASIRIVTNNRSV